MHVQATHVKMMILYIYELKERCKTVTCNHRGNASQSLLLRITSVYNE